MAMKGDMAHIFFPKIAWPQKIEVVGNYVLVNNEINYVAITDELNCRHEGQSGRLHCLCSEKISTAFGILFLLHYVVMLLSVNILLFFY